MKTKVEKLMKANRLEKGELMKKAQRNAYKINIYNHHGLSTRGATQHCERAEQYLIFGGKYFLSN
ncbi:hypothetical protein [Legionella cincinnatiensis]|uniref:Uncharacterized protein n=1 Tax=Legionella cincinnatiensis TaxID=28085 RepID=A0A378ILG8_9GAMM|nr:hypothetical protein [Legionella cincinnatiensis]KTC78758.1 hypothetical protein Lcin_3373 [Legionella cincinnatiensis]STX35351.1 Uncharacterised protein [Legionella cincinnatiensis]